MFREKGEFIICCRNWSNHSQTYQAVVRQPLQKEEGKAACLAVVFFFLPQHSCIIETDTN